MTCAATTLDTEQEEGPEGRRVVPVRPYLFCVLDCDNPCKGGVRYSLDRIQYVLLGRSGSTGVLGPPSAPHGLSITVQGRFASARHAELRLADGNWVLRDLGSTNGTFVNGERITSKELADGDLIEIGHCFFVLGLALPTPARAETPNDGVGMAKTDEWSATLLPALQYDYGRLEAAAATTLPILLVGKTGTGKELTARSIHAASGRQGELVAVNCAALAPTLVESLLFGHKRGAFSGAVRDEPGLLRAASGGTLFLDEIAELPPNVQAMLLRAIQEGEIVPLGTSRSVRVDLRVIAASQVPLGELVGNGTFRADLHARLNGFEFRLPSLAERRVDLGVILRSLLARAGSPAVQFSREAGRALCRYGWPQNIRELDQALRHACALRAGALVGREDLPAAIGCASDWHEAGDPRTAATGERTPAMIQKELEEHGGSIEQTWRALGLRNRFALLRLIKKHGLTTGGRKRSRTGP